MKRASIGVALLIAGFIAGLVLTGRLRSAEESTAQTDAAPEPGRRRARSARRRQHCPISRASPRRRSKASSISRRSRSSGGRTLRSRTIPFFEYFFGGRDDIFGSRDQLARSLGSGVLISSDGYVVTNSHVIGSEKAAITVVFADKHEAPARIIGIDRATDLALVKVAKASEPPLQWGDSNRAKVAEWVLAIGSPYQLNQTVTLGIISALGRRNLGFSEYEDFIQTDAAINQGNSGGALVNARGELIGINTGIISTTQGGGYQGIGFAIPSNLARRIIGELIEHGVVRRGSLGRMNLYPLTTQIADQLGLRQTTGALCRSARSPVVGLSRRRRSRATSSFPSTARP